MSLADRRERPLTETVASRAFAVVDHGLFYIAQPGADRRFPLKSHNFATGRVQEITRLEDVANYRLAVSPDRKSFLFSRSIFFGRDLMLVENFR
jgi:hypothetical protein